MDKCEACDSEALEAHVAELEAEIETLEAQLAECRALVVELAGDVAAYVDAEHPEEIRKQYPHIMAKFERDMDVVRRAEAALRGEGGE